jgi:hypothetical protein
MLYVYLITFNISGSEKCQWALIIELTGIQCTVYAVYFHKYSKPDYIKIMVIISDGSPARLAKFTSLGYT